MTETPERYYRAAAEAYATSKARLWGEDEPAEFDVLAATLDEHLRAAVDVGVKAGRDLAAQAILAHADRHAPERLSALRRHLHIAARVAAGPMTDAEAAEAIQRGDFAVCRLDEAGRTCTCPVVDIHQIGEPRQVVLGRVDEDCPIHGTGDDRG